MKGFKFLLKNKINQLPRASGVYALKKGAKFLYIGKAGNIRERVKNHFQQPAYRDNLFISQVEKIGYIKTGSEIEALILESDLIKKCQPKYNVVWRDDKNYFYVCITKEDFPRIFITHQTKLKIENCKLKIDYIGPFVDGKALKQVLKILRKVFPYRSCFKIPNRPCLWYHLDRCPALCLLKISKIPSLCSNRILEKMKGNMKKICQRNAENLMKVLKAGKNPALKELKKEMKKAAENQDFETAGKIRDQIRALERIMEHAKIFESSVVQITPWCKMYDKAERELRRIVKGKKKISRIEAYDVSNIVGKLATGSMITFINGLPDKKFYRKFRVKISGKPNDTAMLKEIINRRFKHPEWPYPDLILVDGGIAQLNAALQIKDLRLKIKEIGFMSLAKKENKLFIEGQRKSVLLKNLPREIFNLILQLRNEAHRFARKYHHKLRELEFFPGL